MSEQKTKVVVVVPRREFHPGFWSLGATRGQGVFFPIGKTEIEVTPAELEELKGDETRGFITLVELALGEKFVQEKPAAAQPSKK
jgi:hypothetical protein